MDTYVSRAVQMRLASDGRLAFGLAYSDAQQKSAELFQAMDATLRALKALQACGASKDFLWDAAVGLRDQVSNVEAAIHRDLKQRTATFDSLESIDLAELDAFMKECGGVSAQDGMVVLWTPEAVEAVRFVAGRLDARGRKALKDAKRYQAEGDERSYSDGLLETLIWQEATRLVSDLAAAAGQLAALNNEDHP